MVDSQKKLKTDTEWLIKTAFTCVCAEAHLPFKNIFNEEMLRIHLYNTIINKATLFLTDNAPYIQVIAEYRHESGTFMDLFLEVPDINQNESVRVAIELKFLRAFGDKFTPMDTAGYLTIKDIQKLHLFYDYDVRCVLVLANNPMYAYGPYVGYSECVDISDGKTVSYVIPSWKHRNTRLMNKDLDLKGEVTFNWQYLLNGHYMFMQFIEPTPFVVVDGQKIYATNRVKYQEQGD